jgi:hypothetical protein
MNIKEKITSRAGVLSILVLIACSSAHSQSVAVDLGTEEFVESTQKGQFIAAFEWSVEKRKEYVWPFESIRPAPYESVRMFIDQMPRVWPEKGGAQNSVPLSAVRCLQVNGNKLPKPHRSAGSREEFRVSLDGGRLRLSFSLPPGFKLDSNYPTVRIRLYQVE